MEAQRTLVLLKPDCLKRRLVGDVISRIEKKGFCITDIKMLTLTEKCLREHYSHITGEPFFSRVMSYMMSGPVIAMVVEGDGAVQEMRKLIGATKYTEAAPGTIRGDFACGSNENIIHGSDTPENAEIEIKRMFDGGA
ncbi:MAG: nucleoside-diphosphate kinase [Clostridiales bacterium]|jgi:nucleoside-diphosphate kinase|nr:nucleoside-diphosphate kinase [Clostridiales bacterium]